MTKFKVGDRVRLVSNDNRDLGLLPGDLGTVAEDSAVPFVDWDRVNDRWAVLENEIEPVSVAPSTATLTVRAGAYYKTRDGRKVGPMDGWREGAFREKEGDGRFWHTNGKGQNGAKNEDLVAEWVDEPGAVHKFKVGDRVRVSYGHGWDGHGTIESIDKGWDCIVVEMDDGRTGGFSGRHIHSFEPAAVATATAAVPEPTPAVGSSVLIPGWITSINHSQKGTVYGISFETKNRRVSLHFLEEDFVTVDDGDCPCANNNGPVPSTDTAKAFEALGDWLRAVAINPSTAFRSNKEAA